MPSTHIKNIKEKERHISRTSKTTKNTYQEHRRERKTHLNSMQCGQELVLCFITKYRETNCEVNFLLKNSCIFLLLETIFSLTRFFHVY